MITVACVLVKGNVDYDAEYVHRLYLMVSRNLGVEHRFACLTDCVGSIYQESTPPDNFIQVRIAPSPNGLPGWWRKLELFNLSMGLTGRVLYLDLDVLVVGSLDGIANYPAPFALAPTAGRWTGRNGLKVVPRYNSSVMAFDSGPPFDQLWRHWSPSVAKRLWGDQDWIAERMPALATMPAEWFPRISDVMTSDEKPEWPPAARVILCKKPKNHEAARKWSWFNEAWR